MFSSILQGVPVKLDLFHAVQRLLDVLPREVRTQSGIAKKYGMIFRHYNLIWLKVPKNILQKFKFLKKPGKC